MAGMTKKHYMLVANEIHLQRRNYGAVNQAHAALEHLAVALADAFQADSSGFDRTRFLDLASDDPEPEYPYVAVTHNTDDVEPMRSVGGGYDVKFHADGEVVEIGWMPDMTKAMALARDYRDTYSRAHNNRPVFIKRG